MSGRASWYIGVSRSGDSAMERRKSSDTPMLGNWLDVVVVVVVVVWLVVFFEVGKSLLDAMVVALVACVVNEAMSSLGFYVCVNVVGKEEVSLGTGMTHVGWRGRRGRRGTFLY